ncbi:hypothetical protein HCN58_35235 [Bradyrhizobium sp. WSM 1791]|uniref:Transposase IS801/IS1294 domain-containing protein n=1 Tax=Bradyrhizobium australiense TaxID=2721161 RepID=A0A7Y4GZ50_9BRAD|nr:hypothetical protein [Bradyrhizobium australiense]
MRLTPSIWGAHTWSQCLSHHPHLYCVVPGGGISSDGTRWISCRSNFSLPIPVLARLYRRLFLDHLQQAFDADDLQFFFPWNHFGYATPFCVRLLPSGRSTRWPTRIDPSPDRRSPQIYCTIHTPGRRLQRSPARYR